MKDNGTTRTSDTGATRDTAEGKFDFEAFFSTPVFFRLAAYMHKHRFQSDGTIRDGDNWQKGLDPDETFKSIIRHAFQAWAMKRGNNVVCPTEGSMDMEETLGALMFNLMAYWHELLRVERSGFIIASDKPVVTYFPAPTEPVGLPVDPNQFDINLDSPVEDSVDEWRADKIEAASRLLDQVGMTYEILPALKDPRQ